MKKIFFSYIVIFILFTSNLIASNHLESSTSPYLLQHKNNPVDWYMWSDEAFKKAKDEHKLIFLSIGYSTCHWCHVMAEESFENKQIATMLNKDFVSIKVDKEQYPHIDNYYQNIYRKINHKSGGWPLTIILNSDKKPLFSATYIPREKGYGSDGLINILDRFSSLNNHQRLHLANKVKKYLAKNKIKKDKEIAIDKNLALKTINQYKSYYDYENKGFSTAPKFPQATNIILLYKLYQITNSKDALKMANDTLTAMAKGGIFDQISGGFFRYTVDKEWQMPHFEKMLYTNAQLIEAYTLGYKITKNILFKQVVQKTIKEIDKRFMVNHLYKSASNADSKNFDLENEEGFYFLFNYQDTYDYLQKQNIAKQDIENSLNYLGIKEDGNFDGDLSNPHITKNKAPKGLKHIINLLSKLKEKREYPFIDFKINTAWNALYIKAKFDASYIDKKYGKEAIISLDKLLKKMYINGVLYHQTIADIKPTQKALLEDYAFLSNCLFNAYQVTLNKKYFKLFVKFTQESITKFYKNGRWVESNDGFLTDATLSSRGYASALGVNLINLLKYSAIEADSKKSFLVRKTLDNFSNQINNFPSYYPSATLAQLLFKYNPIFIKSNYKNMKQIDVDRINYPFVYKYVISEDIFLACNLNSCFSYSKNFLKVKKDIENIK